MLPFFSWVFPKTAQNLENYRYHLLDAARANAHKNGYKGAQYPWESADDGTEQCPDWTIEPDGTCYRCYVAVYEHHEQQQLLMESIIMLRSRRIWISFTAKERRF